MSSRTLRLLVALLAGALVLGACGDDGGDDAATTTTEADVETDGETEDDEETDEPTESTTTTTDDADETPDTTEQSTDEPGEFDPAALAAIDDFCELTEYGEGMDDPFAPQNPDDPAAEDSVAEGFAMFQALFVRGNELAPPEIEAEFALMTSAMGEMLTALETYDYDFNAMSMAAANDPEVAAQLEAIDSPELQEASDSIDAWVDQNC